MGHFMSAPRENLSEQLVVKKQEAEGKREWQCMPRSRTVASTDGTHYHPTPIRIHAYKSSNYTYSGALNTACISSLFNKRAKSVLVILVEGKLQINNSKYSDCHGVIMVNVPIF